MTHDRYFAQRLVVFFPLALLACGAPELTGSGPDEAPVEESESAAATAANTLTVNANQVLRPVTYVATGSLYGLANATQPSDARVQAIKPHTFIQKPAGGRQQPDGDILVVAPTAARAGAKLVNRLSDYYPGWPYQFSWSTWTPFVNSQIAAMKASPYYNSISAYELWNEADQTWLAANGTYEAFWTTTFRQVRALDPTKPIQGPSFSDNINDMRKFLANAVATNTVPDILSWHELIRSSKIAGDIATVRQIERELGITPPRPINIGEYAAPSEVGLPGPLVGYIAKFERHGVRDAQLAFWNQSGTLGDLLTSKGGSPNAAYWLYVWYAEMTGNMVVTTPPAQTGIDGFAAVPASNDQVSVIVGGCAGDCAVTVNGLNALGLGATVNVKVEQTVSLGRTVASSGPSTMSTRAYTPVNGTISVPITMAANNAYRITITGSGPQGGPASINAGGTATGAFVADAYFSGGSTYSTTAAIDTAQLTGTVPPQSVLQTERYGTFTYTIPGLTAGSPYAVTLYFVESYWTAAGQRLFSVAVNGATVLSAFDIFGAAGGANRAIARTFNTTASSGGQVVIAFTAGSVDHAKVVGITVAAGAGPTSYDLAVTRSGSGAGTVAGGPINCGATCSASLTSGTTVTLTATASAGSTFAGWGGACVGTGTCSVTMTADRAVTASFTGTTPTHALTVTRAGSGGGTVTGAGGINCGATCSATFASGTAVTLTAAAASGSTFTGWSGACSGSSATCAVSMSAAQAVTATFTLSGGTCTAVSGGQSGNFNTTGAACYTVTGTIYGWGCSNAEGRTVTVNGTAVTCGRMPLPGSSPYTFSFTAGTYPWASFYWW